MEQNEHHRIKSENIQMDGEERECGVRTRWDDVECVSVGSSQRCWWAPIDETTMGNAFKRSQHTFFHQSVAIMLIRSTIILTLFILTDFSFIACVPNFVLCAVSISVISHIGCEKTIAIIELLCLQIWYFLRKFFSQPSHGWRVIR